ncbi:hypothetical protein GCM10007886_33310 [Methylobacterium gregans]|nr:hypothetical protein GCM10007886_33310 [Methylobacterium gregans]
MDVASSRQPPLHVVATVAVLSGFVAAYRSTSAYGADIWTGRLESLQGVKSSQAFRSDGRQM